MRAPSIPFPLLDRFLSGGGPRDLEAYADIILRDAEELLNSRLSSPLGDCEGEDEAAYGLPDLTLSGRTEGELVKLARTVRRCLTAYEPRLSNIRVETMPPGPSDIDCLTVRVTAGLAGFEKQPDLVLDLPLSVRKPSP